MPVYNAHEFIGQCIQSVLTQSFQNLELILVDDGSTDESLKICRQWEADPRVTIIASKNRGVSSARNTGLKAATGQWIMFLDSDDYLLPGCLEVLMTMVRPDVQEVLAAYTDHQPVSAQAHETIIYRDVNANSVHAMTLDPYNESLLPDFYAVKPMSLPSSCAKLYRSDVIRDNGISFCTELNLSEDTLFNLEYLSCIEHVVITNLCVVYFRPNASSVTRSFNSSHLANRFHFFSILKDRYGQKSTAHILSLLYFELSKIERSASKHERQLLEQDIVRFLSDNPDVLTSSKNRALSHGRWQKIVYQNLTFCFSHGAYRTGFALFRIYASATHSNYRILRRNDPRCSALMDLLSGFVGGTKEK